MTLRDLLAVDLVLLNLSPYLTIKSILSLASTSKDIRELIYLTPGCFRRVDLSTCRSKNLDFAPIDRGGEIWRAERIDESVTEDDFYGGPLRGILSNFKRWNVLREVQTLVLDKQSVTSDILHDIVCGDEYRVRILSLLDVKHLNVSKFQQTLKYACRTGRAEDRPWLKGVYFFSDIDVLQDVSNKSTKRVQAVTGVTATAGAQLGAQYDETSRQNIFDREPNPYYKAAEKRLGRLPRSASGWASTLSVCKDIIAFDAVLCRGPRHAVNAPAIASTYLSPQGCEICGTMPEVPAIAGKSSISELPMLRPPPLHSSSVRTAQYLPPSIPLDERAFVARCTHCLYDRFCSGCKRFWCENCYQTTTSSEQIPPIPTPHHDPNRRSGQVGAVNAHIKVFMNYCVENCLVSELYSAVGEGGMWG